MIVRPIVGLIEGNKAPDLVSWIFRTSLVMVAAASTDKNAPTRFQNTREQNRRLRLQRTVAIDVAIAFPVSEAVGGEIEGQGRSDKGHHQDDHLRTHGAHSAAKASSFD